MGGVVLLEDEERAGFDVVALILVREMDGSVEFRETDEGRAVHAHSRIGGVKRGTTEG